MKYKLFKIIALSLSILSLSGCVFGTSGESLEAFSRRMNELNESYNMTADGYIIDEYEKTLTKFFKFYEKEIMLSFRYDKKHRLIEMNLVFEQEISEETPDSFIFIEDCIKCFCQNDSIAEEIFEATNFENAIRKIKKETINAEADNIKMEIDTTQLGTVISLYKDI